MGTYTSNYNLFLPSIGEQGWGNLVNGNFTTIDTTMKGLNARIGTLETDTDAVEERVTALEGSLDNLDCSSITADTINGVVIKSSGTYTVTPSSIFVMNASYDLTVLPLSRVPYSGTLSVDMKVAGTFYCTTDKGTYNHTFNKGLNTLGFDNIHYLIASNSTNVYISIPILA